MIRSVRFTCTAWCFADQNWAGLVAVFLLLPIFSSLARQVVLFPEIFFAFQAFLTVNLAA
jgi:hypothetical protein